jgi:hypothetical protein
MINDFEFEDFSLFEDDALFELQENTKAQKQAKKDLAKVMPKPDEEEEIEDNDDFAGDWITITEDDGEDDDDQENIF